MQEYFDQYADEYTDDDDGTELVVETSVPTTQPHNSLESIEQIVSLLVDQRAKDIVVLDNLGDGFSIISSLVICSPFNNRHGASIAEVLRRASKVTDVTVSKRSVRNNSGWFQVDVKGIQINVMNEDVRTRYDLEGLWGAGEEENESEIPLIPPARI